MANNEEISQEVKVEEARPVSAENSTIDKNVNNEKSSKKEVKEKSQKKHKEKKPNKIVKSLKETGSELKKVSWPKFGKVVKQTGVVILFTILFLLVTFGLDRLCSWLVGFIV